MSPKSSFFYTVKNRVIRRVFEQKASTIPPKINSNINSNNRINNNEEALFDECHNDNNDNNIVDEAFLEINTNDDDNNNDNIKEETYYSSQSDEENSSSNYSSSDIDIDKCGSQSASEEELDDPKNELDNDTIPVNILKIDQNVFLKSFHNSYNFIENFDIALESLKYLDDMNEFEYNDEEKLKKKDHKAAGIIKEWNKLKSEIDISDEKLILLSAFMKKHCSLDLFDECKIENSKFEYKQFFHSLSYDCCPEGDIVYVGNNINKIRCPTLKPNGDRCNAQRYHNCNYNNCKNKTYDESCLSHPQSRKNRASINYRSIKLLITELIQLGSFKKLIEFQDSKINLKDVPETIYAKNLAEMKQKFQEFKETYCRDNNISDVEIEIVEINLLISWFYDSFQVYHRKSSIFAPLIMTIKNLPPNIKNKLGFGTFLLSLMTYQSGSEVEKFILFDCFIGELLMFQEGVSIIVEDFNGKKTLFRVQMRVVTHILDMPALCKIMNWENCFNSKYGCAFCNCGRGYFDPLIRKCKYFNTGNCLGMRGYFNLFGTTQKCMPFDWCSSQIQKILSKDEIESNNKLIEAEKVKVTEPSSIVEYVKSHSGSNYDDLTFTIKWVGSKKTSLESWCKNDTLVNNSIILEYIKSLSLKPFYELHILQIDPSLSAKTSIKINKKTSAGYHKDQIYVEGLKLSYNPLKESYNDAQTREKALKTYLTCKTVKGNSPALFLNSDIIDIDDVDYNKMSDDIYSIYCDFRKSEHFEYLTNNQLMSRVLKALDLQKCSNGNKKIAYEGCKDWCMLFILSYINAKDIGWEPAHVLFNICKQILELWKGGPKHRQNLPGVKAYCKLHNIHPSIWDAKFVKEWEFSKSSQSRAQNFLKCLIIPKGSKDKLKFVKGLIFQQSGFLKGMQKLNLMKSLMDLILFSNTYMRPSYKGMFRMLSCILRRFLVKYPDGEELLILFWRSVEWRIFFEKLVPVTEMTLNIHALSECISRTITQFNVYECWACPGERAHYSFKKLIHTSGGIRPELNVWEKYSSIENNRIKLHYDLLEKMMEGTLSEKDWHLHKLTNLSYNEKDKTFIYCDDSIRQRTIYSVSLCDFEYDKIIDTIFEEIKKTYSINNDSFNAFDKSSAYRIIYAIFHQKSLNNNKSTSACLKEMVKPFYSISKLREPLILNPNWFNDKIHTITMDEVKAIGKAISVLRYPSDIFEIMNILEAQLIPYFKILDKISGLEYFGDCQSNINFIRSFTYRRIKNVTAKEMISIQIIEEKRIIDADIQTLFELQNLKKKFYISQNIDFGGDLIKGRGFKFSEKAPLHILSDKKLIQPTNILNKVSKEWYKIPQQSSWIKLKPFSDFKENSRPESPLYANLNYSFSFSRKTNVINCSHLNSKDCFFSSITPYKCKIQHRESMIVTDDKGKSSVQNMYPNQLPESDPFHNSRLPYINLSENTLFDFTLPYFVKTKKIYQTGVAIIGFCKFLCGKDKKIINYKAIDVFSNVHPNNNKKDIISINDPTCKPSILVFIDVSPEVTVQPEKNVIKQEIKDMHKIWTNNETFYDSGSDDDVMQVQNVKAPLQQKKMYVAPTIINNESDDDVVVKITNALPLQQNNKNKKRKFPINIDVVRSKYVGFIWKNNSCAFDSCFIVVFYAFMDMNTDQQNCFVNILGRFGDIFLDISRNSIDERSNLFAKYKDELLAIAYKWDIRSNFPFQIPTSYIDNGFSLPSTVSQMNNSKVDLRSENDFYSGKLNQEEYHRYIANKYEFKYVLGDFLSIFEISKHLLKVYDEPIQCLNSNGTLAVFSMIIEEFYLCKNKNCKNFNAKFLYKNEKFIFQSKKYAKAEIELDNSVTDFNTYINLLTREIGNPDNGSIPDTLFCSNCNDNQLSYNKKLSSFPLLLMVFATIVNRQKCNFNKLLNITTEEGEIFIYKLFGLIYADGAHFTSSVFMDNDSASEPLYYDGMKNNAIFVETNHNYFSRKIDLNDRSVDAFIYKRC